MFEQIKGQMDRAQKDNLKVQALIQRIAQVVAQYENEMAEFRADATIQLNEANKQIESLKAELESRNEVVPEEATTDGE